MVGVVGVEHLPGWQVFYGRDARCIAARMEPLAEHPSFKVPLVFNEAVLFCVFLRDLVRILVQVAQVLWQSHVDKVHVLGVEIPYPIANIDDLL